MSPEAYDKKAVRALVSAQLLLDSGDMEGACNRAYYAMFDAAHAALIRSSASIHVAEIKTHSGLIGAFGKYLVKTGKVSAELGRAINAVEDVRIMADYAGSAITVEEAAWAVEQARIFVAELTPL